MTTLNVISTFKYPSFYCLTKQIENADVEQDESQLQDILQALEVTAKLLQTTNHRRESQALCDVLEICRRPAALGGLGILEEHPLTLVQQSEIFFMTSAWLEALNSADRALSPPPAISYRPGDRRKMTLSEKIFAMHDKEQKGFVTPGELIRIYVDWVIASEASWAVGCSFHQRRSGSRTLKLHPRKGMERTYDELGKPGIFRNDRFWLAGDHVVDPRVNDRPQVQTLINASERAKRIFKMTEYQGLNVSLPLHSQLCAFLTGT